MNRVSTPPDNATKWIAFGCSHAPLHDKESIAVICEAIKEYQPDVILHLGDLFEADSASKWPSEYDWTWGDELWAANDEILRPVREAHPEAECVFLPGNHDDNVLQIGRHNEDIRDSLDWSVRQYSKGDTWLNEELMTHWKMPCKYRYSRRQGTYRIGSTIFFHGYEANASADEFQSITLGWPYGLSVSVHTHRPTIGEPKRLMKTKACPLDRWYLNAGCTREMECGYMARKRQGMWGNAYTYGWSIPSVNSPRFSKTWDGYCQVIKMYE